MTLFLYCSFRYNRSQFYQPSFVNPDYVCSLPEDQGACRCSDIKPSYLNASTECHGSFESKSAVNNSVCVNWNQYYNICKASDQNPFYNTTSFDNIGIAWIAIFQVRKVFKMSYIHLSFYCFSEEIRSLQSKDWVAR